MSKSSIELVIADDDYSAKWDAIVDSTSCGHSTIFHKWRWLKSVEKYTNSEFFPLVGQKGTEPVFLMPLFKERKFFLNMAFSPPPHVAIPFLGPVMVDYDELKQNKKQSNLFDFHDVLNAFLKEQKVSYLNTVFPIGLFDVRPFIWNSYNANATFNYRFDLTQGEERLWQNLKKRTRKNIKNAEKRINVVQGGKDALRKIYSQLQERYDEQNRKLTCKLPYLEEVYDEFSENFLILNAEIDGEFVGGLVNLMYKDSIYSWIGNAKTDVAGLYPNDLLIWKSLSYGCGNNYRLFYEIGANTPRLIKYKANFNPELVLNFTVERYNNFSLKLFKKLYRDILRERIELI